MFIFLYIVLHMSPVNVFDKITLFACHVRTNDSFMYEKLGSDHIRIDAVF